jgi:hypothetical protein
MTIVEAAALLRPGTAWNYDDIHGLVQAEDVTPRVSVPTMDELQALMALHQYYESRAKEYPPITDQLDAIMKGGTALEEMRQRCMTVKAKYPKPQGV